MKLIIGDSEYDVWDSVNYATLGALDDLQEQSATDKFEGITDPYIRAGWVRAAELVKEDKPLKGDLHFRRALQGVVFLAKRRAGEQVTFDEVRELTFEDAQLRVDASEVDDSPKDAGDADPEPSPQPS